MAEDYLEKLPEKQVAGWYRRLADRIALEKVGGQEPLAATLLRTYVDNRDPTYKYPLVPPAHLKNSQYVQAVLAYHRDVLLTKKKGRFTGGAEKWVGVLPRLQALPPFQKWDGRSSLNMTYESLVEVGSGISDIIRIQTSGSAEERDLLTSLRGFQLRSAVTVAGFAGSKPNTTKISFSLWSCTALDRYDWDYTEHFTVPNPDFGSTAPDAVRPNDRSITVYHRNAERLEKAGLAAPYDIESQPWAVTTAALLQPEEVDGTRKLK